MRALHFDGSPCFTPLAEHAMLGLPLAATSLNDGAGERLDSRDETLWSGVRIYASRSNEYALPAHWNT
jgi:hypothetical protein